MNQRKQRRRNGELVLLGGILLLVGLCLMIYHYKQFVEAREALRNSPVKPTLIIGMGKFDYEEYKIKKQIDFYQKEEAFFAEQEEEMRKGYIRWSDQQVLAKAEARKAAEAEQLRQQKQKETFAHVTESYLMAQIIECEVGGGTRTDKIAVGSAILNRIRTQYPWFKDLNTVSEVLYQGYGTKLRQYAPATIKKINAGIQPAEETLQVVEGLLNGTIPCYDEELLYHGFVETDSWCPEIIHIPDTTEHYGKPKDYDAWKAKYEAEQAKDE